MKSKLFIELFIQYVWKQNRFVIKKKKKNITQKDLERIKKILKDNNNNKLRNTKKNKIRIFLQFSLIYNGIN